MHGIETVFAISLRYSSLPKNHLGSVNTDMQSAPAASGPAASRVSLECRVSRSSCMYDGKYEAGERDYAEDEAKRLNRAEMERLRRAFGG